MGNQLVNTCYYGNLNQSVDQLKQYEIDNGSELQVSFAPRKREPETNDQISKSQNFAKTACASKLIRTESKQPNTPNLLTKNSQITQKCNALRRDSATQETAASRTRTPVELQDTKRTISETEFDIESIFRQESFCCDESKSSDRQTKSSSFWDDFLNQNQEDFPIELISAEELMFPRFIAQKSTKEMRDQMQTCKISDLAISKYKLPSFCETSDEESDDDQQGIIDFYDGSKYVGDKKNLRAHGQGTLSLANGDRFKGNFKEGKMHGTGVYQHSEGIKYVGYWAYDLRHGPGQQSFKTGDFYEGNFYKGVFHGKGKLTYSHGAVYEGRFTEGKIEGFGCYTSGNKVRYLGNWSDNKLHGAALIQKPDG